MIFSKDLEFLAVNKISHIVNCAGHHLRNKWTQVGVKYLTFYWLDDDRQVSLILFFKLK
jgi:hypothetical protein